MEHLQKKVPKKAFIAPNHLGVWPGVAAERLWLAFANQLNYQISAASVPNRTVLIAILVYAQELVQGKVGMIAGLFFGLAFGIAGIGSAALGQLADRTSIEFVFSLCAFLPLIGLLTVFLPDIEPHHKRSGSG